MQALIEFFFLTFKVFPQVLWFTWKEEKQVRKHFYKKGNFKTIDRFFRKLYQLKSPYYIYKKHMKSQGNSSVYSYGETPLTVFHQMFKKGNLTPDDCFVDLGCGRGRGLFLAQALWNCNVIGVERVPSFCENARRVSKLLHTKIPKLFCQEISSFNLKLGSFFYFYSICMEEEELKLAILHLEKTLPGSKIVTVSFSLTEHSDSFHLVSSWESTFPWGAAEMFLHVKKS